MPTKGKEKEKETKGGKTPAHGAGGHEGTKGPAKKEPEHGKAGGHTEKKEPHKK